MSDVSEPPHGEEFGFCRYARSLCSLCHKKPSTYYTFNVPGTMIFNNSLSFLSMLMVSSEAFTNLSVTRHN